jgi:ABC-2 type transport system ATP-binding protein
MTSILSVAGLGKRYASGREALADVSLTIDKGEIFALLGPNGAGKTTLINIICGIVMPTAGTVMVDGRDAFRDYRAVRARIGLVPQELSVPTFETVWNSVAFSRGLYGKPANPQFLEKLLRDLSLWERRNSRVIELSGGMKRRVLIAKALSHEPDLLFLDEPTAGVDVELRRDMWNLVGNLRDSGVTIILTTHYIEEAEEMADRVGVISKGKLILVEEKKTLIRKLGKKCLTLQLDQPLGAVPEALARWNLVLKDEGHAIEYVFDTNADDTGVPALLRSMTDLGIGFSDLNTKQSSLEEIFVGLVHEQPERATA